MLGGLNILVSKYHRVLSQNLREILRDLILI